MNKFANQPHVIVTIDRFQKIGNLLPCRAPMKSESEECLSTEFAIFADRDTADAHLRFWSINDGSDGLYFTVPARILFDIERVTTPVYTFTKKA